MERLRDLVQAVEESGRYNCRSWRYQHGRGAGVEASRRDGGLILIGGAVHVAEQKRLFSSEDSSLPGRPFADEFPRGRECVPVQFAGMCGGLLAGKGLLPDPRGLGCEGPGSVLRAGSGLLVRESRFSPTLYRGFWGQPEGAILGLPGARVRVRGLAKAGEDRGWMADLRVVRAYDGGTDATVGAEVTK